jgi:hypothetical protein
MEFNNLASREPRERYPWPKKRIYREVRRSWFHAASLRNPSQSVRNPTTWFQLGVIRDAIYALFLGLKKECALCVLNSIHFLRSLTGCADGPEWRRTGTSNLLNAASDTWLGTARMASIGLLNRKND